METEASSHTEQQQVCRDTRSVEAREGRPRWIRTSFLGENTHCGLVTGTSYSNAALNKVHRLDKLEQVLLQEDTMMEAMVRLDDLCGEEAAGENVITFSSDTVSLWNTEVDQHMLETSTPAFKRGRNQEEQDEVEQEARRRVLQEGMRYTLPHWVRRISVSFLLCTDGLTEGWPKSENKCVLEVRPGWQLRKWTGAIRDNAIRVNLDSIVLSLPVMIHLQCVEHIKNDLGALCRALRARKAHCTVYVCDQLPSPFESPVLRHRSETHNKLVQRAVHALNTKMDWVFFVSMHQYFVEGNNKVIQPPVRYFQANGQLTYVGCMRYWAYLFREVGITAYHVWDDASER